MCGVMMTLGRSQRGMFLGERFNLEDVEGRPAIRPSRRAVTRSSSTHNRAPTDIDQVAGPDACAARVSAWNRPSVSGVWGAAMTTKSLDASKLGEPVQRRPTESTPSGVNLRSA